MAKPTTRQELKDYALQLGYPVLEINVADEQVDDALDDSLQLFQERHFDGVERVLLKYKITRMTSKRGRARGGITLWVSLLLVQALEDLLPLVGIHTGMM